MDTLGLGYRYEREGYQLARGLRYLPDFYVPAWDEFVEIKPALPSPAELRKAVALARQTLRGIYLLIGDPWPEEYTAWHLAGPRETFDLAWSPCRACWGKPRLVVPDPAGGTCFCGAQPSKDDALALQGAFLTARRQRFEAGA
jgi:hypothetical protein